MAARARTFRERGYRRLQVKLGEDPERDAERLAAVRAEVGPGVPLFGDANGLYSTAQARRLLRAAAGVDFWLEQPCATYEECRAVREHCPLPMVLDESIDSLPALLRAVRDGVADGVTLKLSRIGGVTRTVLLRDVAVELGLHVTVEDTGGADLDTAALAHVSLSTPAERRLHTVDFNAWVTVANATGMPAPVDGRLSAPDGPGLGVDVLEDALGAPFLDARVGGQSPSSAVRRATYSRSASWMPSSSGGASHRSSHSGQRFAARAAVSRLPSRVHRSKFSVEKTCGR